MDQFWNRGSVSPSFATAMGAVPRPNVGIDERRLLNGAGRESLIEEERRLDPVGRVRRQGVRLEPERRLPDELIERDVRVVDTVAAAEGAPVVDAIGGADARPPCVLRRVFERPCPGPSWTIARKDQRARTVPGTGIRRVRIERRVLIVGFRPRRLIVEAKAERQGQLVRHLELVVDPRPLCMSHEKWVQRESSDSRSAPARAGMMRTDRRLAPGCCRWRRIRPCRDD